MAGIGMKIIIDIPDDPKDLTIGARIVQDEMPTQNQALALREIAICAGEFRSLLQ